MPPTETPQEHPTDEAPAVYTPRVWDGLDLIGANFDGMCLKRDVFKNCDLSKATFTNADLRWARFLGCLGEDTDFSGADMRFTFITHSDGFNLIGARLLVEGDAA